MVVFDAHTHVFGEEQVARREWIVAHDATFAEMYGEAGAKLATPEQLLTVMDRDGIDRAVAAGFAFTDGALIAEQNRAIIEAARSSARIVPLATVNPGCEGWRGPAEGTLAEGARGFGELRPHSQGWDPLGKEAQALYGMTREAGGVLIWHVSEPVGHRYPGKRGGISASELYRVAEGWPGLPMIAGHLGAELSFFLHMQEAGAVLRDVFFDTAAWKLLYDEGCIAQVITQAGAARVLFGSDYPLLSPGRELQRLRGVLPAESVADVCGLVAEKLFSEREKR